MEMGVGTAPVRCERRGVRGCARGCGARLRSPSMVVRWTYPEWSGSSRLHTAFTVTLSACTPSGVSDFRSSSRLTCSDSQSLSRMRQRAFRTAAGSLEFTWWVKGGHRAMRRRAARIRARAGLGARTMASASPLRITSMLLAMESLSKSINSTLRPESLRRSASSLAPMAERAERGISPSKPGPKRTAPLTLARVETTSLAVSDLWCVEPG